MYNHYEIANLPDSDLRDIFQQVSSEMNLPPSSRMITVLHASDLIFLPEVYLTDLLHTGVLYTI